MDINQNPAFAGGPSTRRPTYRLNRSLLAWTLIVICCVAAGSYGARRYFLQYNAELLLQRAEKAETSGETTRAAQYYSQFLQLTKNAPRNPANDERRAKTLLKLGQLLDRREDATVSKTQVALLYEEALRFQHDLVAARTLLVPLLTQLGRYRDALDHIKVLEPATMNDASAQSELAFRAARCHELLGEYQSAWRRYHLSIAKMPSQLGSYLGLARVWAAVPEDVALELEDLKSWNRFRDLPEGAEPSRHAVIVGLLDQMVDSQPGAEAEAVRATALLGLRLPGDAGPMSSQSASAARDKVLQAADADQNEVLSASETWNAAVPALADVNYDGQITPEELVQRLTEGDVVARRRAAETVLNRLLATTTTGLSEAVSELLVVVFASKLESLDSDYSFDPEVRNAQLAQVCASVIEAAERFPEDPRLQILVADAEQRSMQLAGSVDERHTHLTSAEKALERGLELVLGLQPPPKFDEWKSPVSSPNPDLLLIQLKLALGEILLLRVETQPELAEQDLNRVQQIIGELTEARIDARAPLLLGFRAEMLRPVPDRQVLLEQARAVSREVGNPTPLSRKAAQLLAAMYIDSGDLGSALEIYRRQLKAEPLWLAGRIGLAEVLGSLGRQNEAIAQYETLLDVPGIAERLAVLLMMQEAQRPAGVRNWRKVEAVLDAAQSTKAGAIQSLLLRAELEGLKAVTQGELGRAREDAQLVAQARARLANVETQLRSALQEQPKSVALWTALASTLLRRDDLSADERSMQVSTVLEEARENVGSHPELALAELRAAQLQGDDSVLQAAERIAQQLDAYPEGGKLRLVLALEQTFAERQQPDQARKLLCGYARTVPRDINLHLAVSRALLRDLRSGDTEWEQEWNTTLKRVETLQGTTDGLSLLLRTQRMLLTQVDEKERPAILEKAHADLTKLRRTLPYVSSVLRTLASVEEELGDLDAALRTLEVAMQLGDRSKDAYTQLVRIYRNLSLLRSSRGDDSDHIESSRLLGEASRLIEQFESDHADAMSGELGRLAWDIFNRRGLSERAGEYGSRSAKASGADSDKLNAALYRFTTGHTDADILEVFQRQAQQMPRKSMEDFWPLTLYLIRTKDWEAVSNTIRTAEERLRESPSVQNAIQIAGAWEFLADSGAPGQQQYLSEATRCFHQALQQFPGNAQVELWAARHFSRKGELARAQSLLNGLLDPARAVSSQERKLAVRQLAILQAASGRYSDTLAAIELIERRFAAGESKSAGDVRLLLRIQQRIVTPDSLSRQAALYTELASKKELTDAEQLEFAGVLYRLNRWKESRGLFQGLLQSQSGLKTRARVEYCLALLERAKQSKSTNREDAGRAEPAETEAELLDVVEAELAQLAKDEPHSQRTTFVKARYLAARGLPSDATAQVRTLAQSRVRAQGDGRFEVLLTQEDARRHLFPTLVNQFSVTRREDRLAELRRAESLLNEGKVDEAARWLASTEVAPYLDLMLLRSALECALLLEELHDDAAAESLYRECVEVTGSGDAVRELARFYVKANRLDDALAVCEAEWKRLSPAAVAFIMSMLARADHGSSRERIDAWRQRILENAESLPVSERNLLYLHLGNYDNERGRYDEAIAEYARVNATNNPRFESLNNFAFLSARTGQNLTEAVQAIDAALGMAGPRPDLLDTRALVLIAQGRFPEAVGLLNDMLAERRDATVLFRLAECYHRQGETALAAMALKSAQDAGLEANQLHPLDQAVLHQLQNQPAH